MTDWQTHDSRVVYENHWISVREDQVSRPDGTAGIYGVVSMRHPAAFVVAVTDADEVVLIRQFRYTVGRDSLEIAGGGTDGEDPLRGAQRELEEETGYAADDWQRLPDFYSLNGVSNARGHVFLARGLRRVAAAGAVPSEGIREVTAMPWPDVLDSIRSGLIHDAESIAALMHAALALGKL